MADVEQRPGPFTRARIAALWREAAAALDVPLEDAWCLCGHTAYWHSHGGKGDCEAAEACACAGFDSSDPQRMLKLDALVRAEKAEAECARLREKLDAVMSALKVLSDWSDRMPDAGFNVTSPRCWRWWYERPVAQVRAALGVVGEQEKPT